MQETNEITVYQDEEFAQQNGTIMEEAKDYTIVKLPSGKYEKQMKYQAFASKIAETEEEMLELFQVMNDNENSIVTPMKEVANKEFAIAQFYHAPYKSFDEETGGSSNGVTTIIQDTDGKWYGTSSKAVYYTLANITKVFKTPNTEGYKPIKVKVTSTKKENGHQINLVAIGLLSAKK